MITLYTWLPTPPTVVLEIGIPPDIGHSSINVGHPDGRVTYISFWPEVDGLIARLTYRVKPRTIRNPMSYEIETDRTEPYMQRPADFEDSVDGLDCARLSAGWGSVEELPYDLKRWNCSNVTRLLILISMEPSQLGMVLKASDFELEDLDAGWPIEVLRTTIIEFAAANLFDSKPNDVRRLVKALSSFNQGVRTAPATG